MEVYMKREEYKGVPHLRIQGGICSENIKKIVWEEIFVRDKDFDIVKVNKYDLIKNIELIHALTEELNLNFEIENDLVDGNILFIKDNIVIAEIS
jgi:hypothetical protein